MWASMTAGLLLAPEAQGLVLHGVGRGVPQCLAGHLSSPRFLTPRFSCPNTEGTLEVVAVKTAL